MNQTPAKSVRLLATLGVWVLVATFLLAQIDLWRRHRPGLSPLRYLWPQATQIWLPGLCTALLLAIAAVVLHRRQRTRD
jgi:H+/Cl- antiporter ClcA